MPPADVSWWSGGRQYSSKASRTDRETGQIVLDVAQEPAPRTKKITLLGPSKPHSKMATIASTSPSGDNKTCETFSSESLATDAIVKHEGGAENIRTSILGGRPFCVVIGKAKREFWIHPELLSDSSTYFAAMLKGNWVEAREGKAVLEDVDPDIFDTYQQFLYFRKVESDFAKMASESCNREYNRLIRCYALGDRLGDGNFRDAAVDRIIANSNTAIEGFNSFPFAGLTTIVYQMTPVGSPLRRLVIDQHVHHGLAGWVSEVRTEVFDKEFLYDLSIALLEQRAQPAKAKAPDRGATTCSYHGHATSHGCYKLR